MATFAFKAIDQRGKRHRGTITAASPRHARQKLREQGLRVDSVKQRVERQSGVQRNRSTRFSGQLTNMVRELATLLQAGIPLLDALDSILLQCKRGFKDSMLAVRDKVASGESLADAIAADPRVFDEMTIGMVRVGEHAGNLDEVCEQVADFRDRSGELKDRVISALLYPAIILAVSLGVTVFLMTVVVPMLLQNLTEMDRPLPLPTQILKWASDTAIHYGLWLLMSMFIVASCLAFVLSTDSGRRKWDQIALAAPVLGTLIQKQALSRMSLVVSSLLRSGVELVSALEIAERSSSNGLLKSALSEMRSDLQSGKELGEVTQRHRIFTHSIGQVFALGQQSGQLDKMLDRIGNDYDRQASLLANRLTTVVEPVLILALSLIVGFILFATVLPILEAGNVLAG